MKRPPPRYPLAPNSTPIPSQVPSKCRSSAVQKSPDLKLSWASNKLRAKVRAYKWHRKSTQLNPKHRWIAYDALGMFNKAADSWASYSLLITYESHAETAILHLKRRHFTSEFKLDKSFRKSAAQNFDGYSKITYYTCMLPPSMRHNILSNLRFYQFAELPHLTSCYLWSELQIHVNEHRIVGIFLL